MQGNPARLGLGVLPEVHGAGQHQSGRAEPAPFRFWTGAFDVYVVEIIKRGPVSERTMEIGQQIGFALLMMLMAFAFYNDINRLISG